MAMTQAFARAPLASLASYALAADGDPPKPADDRATTFQPVKGGSEMQSGEALLVEAYASIWVILFVMLFLSWRRQKDLDRRVDLVQMALLKARGELRDDGGKGS